MGLINDDRNHEAALLPEFDDGVRADGWRSGAPDQIIVATTEALGDQDTHVRRPAGAVTGWRVVCFCGDEHGLRGTWVGPLLSRVPSPVQEDLEQHRVYADDADVRDLDYRTDVQELVRALWRTGHADVSGGLSGLTRAIAIERSARTEVDALAHQARAAGATWQQLGDAAGITRQAAQQRWRERPEVTGHD